MAGETPHVVRSSPDSGEPVSSLPANPHGLILRVPVVAVATVWVVAIIIALFLSLFGRFSMVITSGDWAQHMLLVETDFHNARLAPGQQAWNAGNLEGVPGWSQAIVAYTAAALAVNPLQSMQIWTTIFLITGCFVMAVRFSFHANGPPSLAGVGIASVFLAACAYAGFALRGHIQGNYFFAQLAGTVIAITALAALQLFEWDVTLGSLTIVLLGGVVLPNIHLLPAMWFTLAGLIHLYLTAKNWRMAFVQCAFVSITNLLLWRGSAGAKMVSDSNTNGWFLIRFTQLSDHGTYLAIGLGVVFWGLSLALLTHLRPNALAASRWRLAHLAGLFAVCLLICLQSAMYLVLHVGSVYSIAKWLYLLGTEMAVLLIGVRWRVFPLISDFSETRSQLANIGCFVLLFLSQGPFLSTPYDQTTLMRLRGRLLALRLDPGSEQRSYPQFPSLGYDQNYYLAIAIMRIPRDERTIRWLYRAATGEKPVTLADGPLVPFPNADFEGGTLSPWLPYLSAEPKIDADQVHGGKFALAETGGDGSVYQDVSGLVPGDYTFTAFVSGTLGGTATAQLALWEPGPGPAVMSPVVTPGPSWQLVSQSVTVGAPGIIRLHLLRHPGQGTIYWDDTKLARMQ
jgi:hypothetical protein